jgi:uncharacterized membrane protein YeaQ/YmgE (transglycosylase-associated protein family)
MNRTPSILLMTIAAGPALAQVATEEALGAGIGLVFGLVIAIVIGAVVGWLASLIVKGGGSGFWSDVLIGIGGSILAGFLFPLLGLSFGSGVIGAFLPALIGAVILILIIRLVRRGTS